MIRLLQLLFFGHWHKWKIIEQARLWGADSAHMDKPTGLVYFLQCEKCGEVKRRTLDS